MKMYLKVSLLYALILGIILINFIGQEESGKDLVQNSDQTDLASCLHYICEIGKEDYSIPITVSRYK